MSEPLALPAPRSFAWVALIIAITAFTAVSSDSFWIDECWTAEFATASTLRECWSYMARVHFPEIQAPLYMIYIWLWVHLFGSSEWIMRAAGTPWFVGGALIWAWYLRRLVGPGMIPALLIALSPFAWYYLNEARLYAMQLGFSCAVIGAGIEIARSHAGGETNRCALRIFSFALVGLCGSNVLGAVFGVVFFVALLCGIGLRNSLNLVKMAPLTSAATAALLVALCVYYAWTRTVEPRASTVGTTTPQSVAFVIYELFGMAGLGPPRNILRSSPITVIKPYVPVLMIYAAIIAIAVMAGIREAARRIGYKKLLLLILLIVGPPLLLAAVGAAIRFRMLGRHITPILPMLWVLLAFGIAAIWRTGRTGKAVAAGLYLFCLASCVSLRFAERHKKDDYRGAAARTREVIARGGVAWWAADSAGGRYYGLPTMEATGSNKVCVVVNSTAAALQHLPVPVIIAVSKPDTYDNSGAVAAFALVRDYTREELPAFTIYRQK